MTELTETVTEVVPALGKKLIFFTATKTAQNDTIDFDDYSAVRWCAAHTGGSADTVTISGTTITLAGSGTGTVYGIAIVEE